MGKHVTETRRALKDPWVMAVIIAEIAGIITLIIVVPQVADNAVMVDKLVQLLAELAILSGT